ncbi:TetR/AcrR family transcriptional regulator [Kordiimonas gwangyangensis]|uniref:TetR/AcrR family transcriptional regulator n=1 Tax=Kordiimonas gwangyangensis TaxID=288022 RepID=UPI0003A66989|nr:TetR/AcrR family transcriptional regulator [Kordiimonas gwangyangensis]
MARTPTTGAGDGKTKRADATRASLIEAAERLIALKGIAHVSTREILQEAGQRNQSALQYHFGSKAGLVRATISERTHEIDDRRLALMEEWTSAPSLAQIIEVLVLPLAERAENDEKGRYYLIFLGQAITQPDWDLRHAIKDFEITGLERAYEFYDQLLSHLSDEQRIIRQEISYDAAILTLKRWCLRGCKSSAREVVATVVQACVAILEMETDFI